MKSVTLRPAAAKLAGLLTGALMLCGATAANAALMFQFERVDDRNAILTATGTATAEDSQIRTSSGTTTVGGPGADTVVGNFAIGGVGLGGAAMLANTNVLNLFFSNRFAAGDVATGASTIRLFFETWAPVGTSGILTNFDGSQVQGTWEIVASKVEVPEPGALALFGIGLLGIAGYRRRRQRH